MRARWLPEVLAALACVLCALHSPLALAQTHKDVAYGPASTQRLDVYLPARDFAAKARLGGGQALVLAVDLNHGDVNGQLGLASPYTQAVDDFVRGVGLPVR